MLDLCIDGVRKGESETYVSWKTQRYAIHAKQLAHSRMASDKNALLQFAHLCHCRSQLLPAGDTGYLGK